MLLNFRDRYHRLSTTPLKTTMPLKPASMFACGCKLSHGVTVIMLFHLAACLAYVSFTFMDIVLHMKQFGLLTTLSPLWQFSVIGFQLSGVVIIALALYGMKRQIEIALRVYLCYLLATFVLNTVLLVDYFVFRNSNCMSPGGSVGTHLTANFGLAFLCGFTRILSYVFVAAVISLEVYCLYIVWSLCEDVHEGVWGPGIYSLLDTKEEALTKEKDHNHHDRSQHWHFRNWMFYFGEGPYADIAGLNGTKLPGPFPNPYATFDKMETNQMFGGMYSYSY